MKTLLFFAYRNLLRQKRRAVLLGTAMALGTCFLVLASSFVAGITQTLFERVMTYVAGHASVIVGDRGYLYRPVLRGQRSIADEVSRIPHVKRVDETMGIMCRMVGSRKGDNGILIGIDLSRRYSEEEMQRTRDNFPMVSGDFTDLSDSTIGVPAILAKPKADFLGVGQGDQLAVRFQDSRGRRQVAHLTVVGLFQPANSFMEAPLFISMDRMKSIMDMDSTDLPYLYLTVEDPERNAIPVADSIWRLIAPRPAALPVRVEAPGRNRGEALSTVALGIKSDSASRDRFGKISHLELPWKAGAVALPEEWLSRLGTKIGDTVRVVSGVSKAGDTIADRAVVAGTWKPSRPEDAALLWEEDAFQAARSFRSRLPGDSGQAQAMAARAVWDSLVSPEWELMPRAKTTDEVKEQMRLIGTRRWKAPVVGVRTMYEMGEQILKLASALNVITLVAVLILFVVVLTGVVNTLRMTVRERTREIGTLRSLGMQASQVRTLFLLETSLLALFSSLAGTALAGLAMFGLSRMSFTIEGNPLSILLVRGHLVFVTGFLPTLGQIALVTGMAVLAAWRPAVQASKLSPADALRHHE